MTGDPETAPEGPAAGDERDGPNGRDAPRVVVPAFGAAPDRALQVGGLAAATLDGELVVLDVRCGGEGSADVDPEAFDTPTGLCGDAVTVREVDGAGNPADAVVRATGDLDAALLVVDEQGDGPLSSPLRGDVARRVSAGTDCDSVVVSDNREHETIASVLVPVSEGPHSATAVDVAGAVASAADAWVELLHVVDDEDDEDDVTRAAALLDEFAARLPDDVEVERWIFDEGDVADVVVDQSTYYDLTVTGAPDSNRLKQLLFGSVPGSVRDRAENTVLVTRRGDRSAFPE